ncbi:dynein regulation protein LC7 [Streptomyces lunaelactis]|uniref:Dynein regulation protein LC7 n=1 Tax=Streptomyces lunaelactis TaxID=1535768 RepID=A0A2R4TFD3_9ACTN|nr:roadblock/LC7 domain-containing protein [Streptomyces lunaelactis]AVZ77820.1 dynein regulation protein LC7 [Streptomyces lunaelactis]NUJ99593.1 roadblock/LC7 domain-containing protein [Streptomyces lunaelactis]NUK12918.1 roadblock/LC7 domain-containing protein [Streptomyces lunaelactis]NUK20476.1 roadblock/LC7 domain-containing protein [Streptomyces lunaelactis]NUK21120.1 roadblock/LC7 domain-containing protein [Streptomyces lunaelactis]
MDWMLNELAASVPYVRHVVVLSSDGLCIGQANTETDTADAIAAACSGMQSLAKAIALKFPHGDGSTRMVGIEVDGGYFSLMAAGPGAYLAVLADEEVDAGLLGARMRTLVVRIGQHMTSPPRDDVGQAM